MDEKRDDERGVDEKSSSGCNCQLLLINMQICSQIQNKFAKQEKKKLERGREREREREWEGERERKIIMREDICVSMFAT